MFGNIKFARYGLSKYVSCAARIGVRRKNLQEPGSKSRFPGAIKKLLEYVASRRTKQGVPKKVKRCECLQQFAKFMAQEIDVHKQSGESPPPDPVNPYQPNFWSQLKARHGLTERSISRLTDLGKEESIRRFLWTQHQRQSRMLRLIQQAKPSLHGRKRILKGVVDQMPAFLDPYKQQKTVMTTAEAESSKGCQAHVYFEAVLVCMLDITLLLTFFQDQPDLSSQCV